MNSYAQQSRESFGQNRIQFKYFNWKYYSTVNFDIYYYDGSDRTAQDVAVFLEDEFDRITEVIGHNPYFKAKVFLYNSVNDLQQSNIGVNKASYRIGGQTNFTKTFVEVANPGSIEGLKAELLSEVSNLVLEDMVYGGSLGDMWQNSYLMNLPDWFVKGAAEYLAKGWDIEMDDQIRDLIASGRINKLTNLTGRQAIVAGQSLWNYIVEKYGRSNLNQILNLVRVTRNEERSISFTLGVSFKQVLSDWKAYYTEMLEMVQNHYRLPDLNKISERLKDDQIYSSVKLSPNGEMLAYAINDDGKFRVYIEDIASGKKRHLLSGGYKLLNQKVDILNPIINWADDKTLGIVSYKKGKNVMWLYDLETDSKLILPLESFDQIGSFDFSGNGRLAALSATRNGKTDIYLLSVRRNKVRQLTNDYFDDITPSFVPGTNTILFASNRVNDTIVSQVHEFANFSPNFNLYAFNLDTTNRVLTKLTNTISTDYAPVAENEKVIYYLSDQKGIVNLFKFDVEKKIYSQITNFQNNIIKYDINFTQGNGAFTMSNKLRQNLFYVPDVKLQENNFTPLTPRQIQLQARYLSERRLINAAKRRSEPIKVEVEKLTRSNSDTLNVDSLVVAADSIPEKKAEETLTDIINTDDYVFDKEIVKKTEKSESFLSTYRRVFEENNNPVGPFNYKTQFSADNMITSWVIDPFRGFGILLETEMNDVLQNHKFYGGVLSTMNLKSGDVFAEYQYLENRIDYKIRYDRNVWFQDFGDELRQRYTLNKMAIGASLPFNPKLRLSLDPYFMFTKYQDLNFSNLFPSNPDKAESNVNAYLGITSELVYDNTSVLGENIIEGTRFKAEFSHAESLNDKARSFSRFTFDFRHYQKIFRSLVLASRVYYGSYFGRFKHNFMIGGMDNWLFKNEHYSLAPWYPEVSVENNNVYFVKHVTSLRGFDYNTLHGTSTILANFELRLPVVRFFYNGPVRSSFLSNLQFVGFFDIGSAWTGVSPFNRNNSISVVTINEGSFEAEIQTFKNPWLMGYGGGLRTVMLGYFMKFDLAFPIEDNNVGKSKFYITLGHDF